MRRTLWLIVLFAFAIAAIYTVYGFAFDRDNPLLLVTTAVAGAIGTTAGIDQLWDRYGAQHKHSERPSAPDEKAYLEGLLRAFAEEQTAFVALAGDAIIESRFDAYTNAFAPEHPGDRLREYDDIAQAVRDFKQFVIIGDPGAGKSTTLRQIVSTIAHARLETPSPHKNWLNNLYRNIPPPLPLWMFLGDSQNPPAAKELLNYWWEKHYLPNSPEIAMNRLDVWLFIDGLNEMPEHGGSAKERAASLKAFLETHPDLRAVVTCRLRDYDKILNLGLPVVHVQPLDTRRVKEFVQKRLGSSELLEKLADNIALKNITSNPYTLVMLIEVYRDKGQLPTDLNDLYRLYTLERYNDYYKRGLVKIEWKLLERGLQRLAFRMIARSKGTAAPTWWAQRHIGLRILREGISLGVLVEEGNIIRFYHESLQSYFALPGLKKAIHQRWYDRWWPERRKRFIARISDLGEAASPAVPALIDAFKGADAFPLMRVQLPKSLARIGAPAVPDLIEALKSGEPDVYYIAQEALYLMGENAAPATPILIKSLKDSNGWEHAQLVEVLQRIGASAVPALLASIKSTDDRVREGTMSALRGIGKAAAPAVPDLIHALKDTDANVRYVVIQVLESIGKAAAPAVPDLIRALKDTDKRVQHEASVALRNIGTADPVGMLALVEALKDSDTNVRQVIVNVLKSFGLTAIPALPNLINTLKDIDYDVRFEATSAIASIGPWAVPALLEALKTDGDLKWGVVWTLGQIFAIFMPDNQSKQMDMLSYVSDDKRVQQAGELIVRGHNEAAPAIPYLINALKDSNVSIRLGATWALGNTALTLENRLVAAPSVPDLVHALKDTNANIRRVTAQALGRIGEASASSVPDLITCLKDSNVEVRQEAAWALGEIGEASVASVPALIDALRDDNFLVRFNVTGALKHIGSQEALEALEGYQGLKQ